MHERQIVFDCPHCGSSKVAFTSAGYKGIPGQPELWIVLMQCGYCSEGIVVKLRGSVPGWLNSGQRTVQVISVHPRAQPPTAPEYVPTNVGGFYEQGLDCVLRKNFDAAGAMFRKALDTAVKIIHPAGKGVLAARIDAIPTDTGITPAMKEWAHEIRLLGNDAAHEEDPFTPPEAESLQAFTQLFLTYAFTLPGMLAARKASSSGL